MAVLPRLGYETRLMPGSVLLSVPSAVRREWMLQEKELVAYLSRTQIAAILDMYRVNVVVDVGAHRGQFARGLRESGYRGRIVSFEPTPDGFAGLSAAAASDPRWEIHQLALGREDGFTDMQVVPGTLSSLLPPTRFGAGRYPKLQRAESVRVQVRRLDGLLDGILAGTRNPRPYLKLDTQGFDLEVFAGIGDRVSAFVGMQSEVALLRIYQGMPRMPEALQTYEAAGFEVAGLYPVSRQRRTARVLEYDVVLVRASALSKSKPRPA
jgi:FkbM family methyltransferase